MIAGARRRSVRRAASAGVLLLGAVLVIGPSRVSAAPTDAHLVAGVKEPGTDTPPSYGTNRLVLNGVNYVRLGVYGLTINGSPARGLSMAVQSASPDRHRAPSATDLVQSANTKTSPFLDYLLWKYSGTNDPVQAAALHLVVWNLVGVGASAIPASILFHDDPPLNAAGGSLPAAGDALGDLIEHAAADLLATDQHLLGPWTLGVSASWATKSATVMVRSWDNTGVPGVTVNLSSANATVPASVVTDSNGEATFSFTPLGTEASVTASASSPGVHSEYDVDAASSGYQRVAVSGSSELSGSFTVKEPLISSSAIDATDGDKLVGAGGSIIDILQYQNLIPGGTYTAQVIWYYQDTGTPSALTTTKTFQASGTGAGNVQVGPVSTGANELGRNLVAYQFLFNGNSVSGIPEVIHANLNDANQTLTVFGVQITTNARDVYDSDNVAFAGAQVMDTVSYVGLAPGLKYTAKVEWHYTDGNVDLGSTGLTATSTFFGDQNGFGTVDVGPVSLTGAESGTKIVAFEHIYVGDTAVGTPLVAKDDPDDANQSIDVIVPDIITVAQDVADGDKLVQALGNAQDQLVFANLHPDVTYTARLEWHLTDGALDLGPTGIVATKTFTPDAPTGGIVVGPTHLTSAVSSQKIVAFERIYLGPTATGTPVAVHESPFDPAQTLQVLAQTIFTEATEGTAGGVAKPGDKQIVVGASATIVDTVSLNASAGAAIQVIGQLVRYENGVCGDALQTVTFNTTVPADKTFTIVYAVPEAPGDYVSFVIVKTPQGFVIADHQDCASETQRVSVVGDTLPETH